MKLRAKCDTKLYGDVWLTGGAEIELDMDDFEVVEGHQVCCCGQHIEKEITKEDYEAIRETVAEALHKKAKEEKC